MNREPNLVAVAPVQAKAEYGGFVVVRLLMEKYRYFVGTLAAGAAPAQRCQKRMRVRCAGLGALERLNFDLFDTPVRQARLVQPVVEKLVPVLTGVSV